MKLTANITLDELTKSQTAERKGINNNPSPEQIDTLQTVTNRGNETTKSIIPAGS